MQIYPVVPKNYFASEVWNPTAYTAQRIHCLHNFLTPCSILCFPAASQSEPIHRNSNDGEECDLFTRRCTCLVTVRWQNRMEKITLQTRSVAEICRKCAAASKKEKYLIWRLPRTRSLFAGRAQKNETNRKLATSAFIRRQSWSQNSNLRATEQCRDVSATSQCKQRPAFTDTT